MFISKRKDHEHSHVPEVEFIPLAVPLTGIIDTRIIRSLPQPSILSLFIGRFLVVGEECSSSIQGPGTRAWSWRRSELPPPSGNLLEILSTITSTDEVKARGNLCTQ